MSAILRVRLPDGTVIGIPAIKGDPGYTPVKGTDYYTEADKQEMVAAVMAELPVWEGGSY